MKKSEKFLLYITSTISLVSVLMVLFITFGFDVRLPNRVIISNKEYQNYNDLMEISYYLEKIKEDYYDSYDIKQLQIGAIQGLFQALPDGYSRYFTKEELQSKKLSDKGESIAIGIVLEKVNQKYIIQDIKEDGPANQSGLKVGDQIIKINDIELSEDTYEKALLSLRSNQKKYLMIGEYTDAIIQVLRDNQFLTFTVKREKLVTSSVESKLDGDFLYIKINHFIESTFKDYRTVIDSIKPEQLKGIILDLRDNPGGLVDEASDVAGSLVGKKIIYYTVSKGSPENEHISKINQTIDSKIVVLVNENTASASELLVGALKDYNRATIVGSTTYGKGIIQTTFTRLDGSGYRITTSEYLTPNQWKIHKVGIEPNHLLTDKDDPYQFAKELLNEG